MAAQATVVLHGQANAACAKVRVMQHAPHGILAIAMSGYSTHKKEHPQATPAFPTRISAAAASAFASVRPVKYTSSAFSIGSKIQKCLSVSLSLSLSVSLLALIHLEHSGPAIHTQV